ncbi:MAG: type 4a pilus biogenesis protein PilO [Clostridium sp.]|nr:type 4a pilus biogenesis protein PilO [Clostridium sp.]
MNNQQTLPYMIGLVFCLIVGIYLLYPKVTAVYTNYNEVKTKTQAVEQAKQQIADLKAQKESYEREEKVSTKPVYKNDIATVDPMSSFGVMFEDVIQSAKYNGLKLRSISYNTAPGEDVVQKNISSDYNVCAISMQLIGNYMQFRSYFQDIYNYPYLINLDKISIKPYENNKRILIADITVTLYSVKNEAQKAAAAAAAELAPQGDQAAAPVTTPEAPMPGM